MIALPVDFSTGVCACRDGWASSDGNGGPGDRGDCGYRYEFCTDGTQEAPSVDEAFALLLLEQAADT